MEWLQVAPNCNLTNISQELELLRFKSDHTNLKWLDKPTISIWLLDYKLTTR
jgi:hypothetical protein